MILRYFCKLAVFIPRQIPSAKISSRLTTITSSKDFFVPEMAFSLFFGINNSGQKFTKLLYHAASLSTASVGLPSVAFLSSDSSAKDLLSAEALAEDEAKEGFFQLANLHLGQLAHPQNILPRLVLRITTFPPSSGQIIPVSSSKALVFLQSGNPEHAKNFPNLP